MGIKPWLALGACVFAGGLAWAGSAEDFKSGQEAYRRGDVRAAIATLRKSADGGHAPSQALLGEILDLAEQNEEAVKYLRLAADQGDADGAFGLATMYAAGEGVARDPKAAREWMTRAAQSGHRAAVHSIALAYVKGGLGVADAERGSPEALQWIQMAAANDSLEAIDHLAVAYRQGQYGLAADPKKAEELEARSRALRKVVITKPKKNPPKAVPHG